MATIRPEISAGPIGRRVSPANVAGDIRSAGFCSADFAACRAGSSFTFFSDLCDGEAANGKQRNNKAAKKKVRREFTISLLTSMIIEEAYVYRIRIRK